MLAYDENRLMNFTTPILLLAYNRPALTEQTFNTIRQQKPERLYVALDGVNVLKDGDAEKCEVVKAIIKSVDWDCKVKVLYRQQHLGCKLAVSGAINWFFEQEEEGIILEDDCLPCPDFFKYCSELLEYYRNDEKVWMISGTNQMGEYKPERSYHYVRLGSVWGWASWRRAWQNYDVVIKDWPENKDIWAKLFKSKGLVKQRTNATQKTYQGEIDTWDYQWAYAMAEHGAYAVMPSVNLVENIGFGSGATHTFETPEKLYNKTDKTLKFPLNHPPNKILLDDLNNLDDLIFNFLYPKVESNTLSRFQRVKSFLKI